jgi:hypothetical protein
MVEDEGVLMLDYPFLIINLSEYRISGCPGEETGVVETGISIK